MHTPDCCKSVFKNGTTVPSMKAFTQAFISMINQLEQSKAALTGVTGSGAGKKADE